MINQPSRFACTFLLLVALAANAQAATTTILSVNFQTQATHVIPEDATNMAGVVAAPFWNNADSGGLTSATLNDGTSHAIGVSMNADASHLQIPTPTNNDERLMGDSFDLHGGTLTLSVSNLPTAFTTQGYDVYLYLWGATTIRISKVCIKLTSTPDKATFPRSFFSRRSNRLPILTTAAKAIVKITPVRPITSKLQALVRARTASRSISPTLMELLRKIGP